MLNEELMNARRVRPEGDESVIFVSKLGNLFCCLMAYWFYYDFGLNLITGILILAVMWFPMRRQDENRTMWTELEFVGLTKKQKALASWCEFFLRLTLAWVTMLVCDEYNPLVATVFFAFAMPYRFYWVLLPHRVRVMEYDAACQKERRRYAEMQEKAREEKAIADQQAREDYAQAVAQANQDLVAYLQDLNLTTVEDSTPQITEESGYRFSNTLALTETRLPVKRLDNDDKLAFYETSAKHLMDWLNYVQDPTESIYDNLENCFTQLDAELNGMGFSTKFNLTKEALMELKPARASIQKFLAYWNNRRQYLLSDYKSVLVGHQGEVDVNEELAMHVNLINLPTIRVEVDGNSVETDNVVLTPKGIFALEVKNIGLSGNFTLVIESDGRWLRRYQDGRTELMSNASAQNTRHIAYLNRLINQELGLDLDSFIDVKGLVVIANDRISIENHSTIQTVLRKSDVYAYIQQHPSTLSKAQLEDVQRVLLAHNLPPLTYPVTCLFEELEENLSQVMPAIQGLHNWLAEH